MNRRSFLQAIGLAPSALMLGKTVAAEEVPYGSEMQKCYKDIPVDGTAGYAPGTVYVRVTPCKKSDAEKAEILEKVLNYEIQKNYETMEFMGRKIIYSKMFEV